MDDPIPIEGIIEGDPEALAAVCAAGGSAVIAYCAAVGAQMYVAETVVAALGDFRRGVVANADQEPAQLQNLLLSVTHDAARLVAGVAPSPAEQTAAQAALEGAETAPLAPGLAWRIISALVLAAPVTALGGDATAVRRAAERHYLRTYDAGPAAAAPAPSPSAKAPAAEAAWVPPELESVGDQAAESVPAQSASARWRSPASEPAGLPDDALVPAPAFDPAPTAAHDTDGDVVPGAVPPPRPPPPGALVIKRGGHWPFRRTPKRPVAKRPVQGGGAGRARNVLLAGVVGLAIGAGLAALAMPQKTVQRNTILVRPLDTPFTVGGAVFNVARTDQAQWALEIRRRPPAPGRTWLTLAAQTRNVSRVNFHPRGLGYRLRTPAGIVIGPVMALAGGAIPADGRALPIGKRTSVHLGFQVPQGQRDLTLEFDPTSRGTRIRVPLN